MADFDLVGGAGNTISVVERGIELSTRAKRERRPYIHTWCVFDRDEHPTGRFNDAIQRANATEGLTAIWSNEAFELWYLLHFGYVDASLRRDEINRKLSRHLGCSYEKDDQTIFEKLALRPSLLEDALRNAEKLMSDNRSPLRNPSLKIHLLIRRLLKIKEELSS